MGVGWGKKNHNFIFSNFYKHPLIRSQLIKIYFIILWFSIVTSVNSNNNLNNDNNYNYFIVMWRGKTFYSFSHSYWTFLITSLSKNAIFSGNMQLHVFLTRYTFIVQRLYYHRADVVLNFCPYFLPFVFWFDFKIFIVFKTCFSHVF